MDSDSQQPKGCRVALRGILAFFRGAKLLLKAQRAAAGRAGRRVGSYLVPMQIRITRTFSKSSAEKKHCTEMIP